MIPTAYSGALTREQFLYRETRIAARLLREGLEPDKALQKICEENLFQYPTERTVRSVAKACFRRIAALGSDRLTELLAESSADTARQTNLYAMMLQNRLVWDFMTTVIGEKYRVQDLSFKKSDVLAFLTRLREQEDDLSGWSEKTYEKIAQVLKKALVECGYLDSPRAKRLNNFAIAPALEEELRARGDIAALCAFNCFIPGG